MKLSKKTIILTGILALAAILRFYDYKNRFGLAYDQAHSAIIARFALDKLLLPLLGPFSSGGPFQTGGEWYWIVMLGGLFYPHAVITPWVFLTALTVLSVWLMFLVGRELINSNFGLLLGLLTAVSTAQVTQSTNLSNQTPIILFSVLSILCMAYYLKTTQKKYLFFMSFVIGFGSAIQIQAFALVPFLLLTALFSKEKHLKDILIMISGGILPWVPVLLADSQNGFYNTQTMISFFFQPSSQATYEVLGRRWLTFITEFIPQAWAFIIGGFGILGYVLPVITAIVYAYAFQKRTLRRWWIITAISLFIMIVLLRYIKTPLFESFYVFLHPFILLLTGVSLYYLMLFKRVLGVCMIIIIIFGSLYINWTEHLKSSENTTADVVAGWKRELEKAYPNQTFAIYDFRYSYVSKSLPLVLFLQTDNLISDEGRKIGIAAASGDIPLVYPEILSDNGGLQLYDLSGYTSNELNNSEWSFVNPSQVYKSTQSWYTLEE